MIKLLDINNNFLKFISFNDAKRLIRNFEAKLLVMEPATIQLIEKISNVKKEKTSHEILKFPLYGNFIFLNLDGEEIFHANWSKVLWYLSRNLIEVVSVEPPTFKLKFQAKGPGCKGDNYYLAKKINQCVVCGKMENLTRHHVLPDFYRKFMPRKFKANSY